jgi:hypothetical protein
MILTFWLELPKMALFPDFRYLKKNRSCVLKNPYFCPGRPIKYFKKDQHSIRQFGEFGRYIQKIRPEFSCLLRFFHSAKINQSEAVIPDIDQSPSSIFAELKNRSKLRLYPGRTNGLIPYAAFVSGMLTTLSYLCQA